MEGWCCRMKQVNLSKTTISYIDEGKGEAIVLLHGFCGSSEYWDKIIPDLTRSYRVIAPDLPGHGKSTPINDEYSIDDLADQIMGLLNELKIEKVTLFGHSLGGYISMAFAEKYSSRLNGFSLVHSTAYPDTEEAKKGRLANVEKIDREGIKAFIDGLVPNLFSPENRNAEYVEMAKQIGYATSPQGAANTLLAMKNRPNRNDVLAETKLPVLLIAGEKDQIVAKEKTFSVTKSTITQSIIQDAGHMSMYENPQALISVMREFLTAK